jgi:hypothetical protein
LLFKKKVQSFLYMFKKLILINRFMQGNYFHDMLFDIFTIACDYCLPGIFICARKTAVLP